MQRGGIEGFAFRTKSPNLRFRPRSLGEVHREGLVTSRFTRSASRPSRESSSARMEGLGCAIPTMYRLTGFDQVRSVLSHIFVRTFPCVVRSVLSHIFVRAFLCVETDNRFDCAAWSGKANIVCLFVTGRLTSLTRVSVLKAIFEEKKGLLRRNPMSTQLTNRSKPTLFPQWPYHFARGRIVALSFFLAS